MALDFTVFRNPLLKKFMNRFFSYTNRLVDLGAPVLANTSRIVASANMKVGAYTIAAQPDVTRNITLTHTQVGGVTDTLGTVVVVGTNALNQVISETITPVSASTVTGTKAFKTITSVTGVGWVVNSTADTIVVGIGTYLGMPFVLESTASVMYGVLGTANIVPANVTAGTTVEGCYVNLSSGTYDGSKKAFINIVD